MITKLIGMLLCWLDHHDYRRYASNSIFRYDCKRCGQKHYLVELQDGCYKTVTVKPGYRDPFDT